MPPLPLNADLLNLCALLAEILFLKQGLLLTPRPSLRFCGPSLVQGDLGWTGTSPKGHDLVRVPAANTLLTQEKGKGRPTSMDTGALFLIIWKVTSLSQPNRSRRGAPG